jgi:hypothetical protein
MDSNLKWPTLQPYSIAPFVAAPFLKLSNDPHIQRIWLAFVATILPTKTSSLPAHTLALGYRCHCYPELPHRHVIDFEYLKPQTHS